MPEPTNKKLYEEVKKRDLRKAPETQCLSLWALSSGVQKARGDLQRRQIKGVFGALV